MNAVYSAGVIVNRREVGLLHAIDPEGEDPVVGSGCRRRLPVLLPPRQQVRLAARLSPTCHRLLVNPNKLGGLSSQFLNPQNIL